MIGYDLDIKKCESMSKGQKQTLTRQQSWQNPTAYYGHIETLSKGYSVTTLNNNLGTVHYMLLGGEGNPDFKMCWKS